ncbi:MAG TPA: hypothetical protein VKD72_35905 [Gemmataceae bacterium]|nr:hypothetical protein [Gemmataceae bacterium]
MDLGLNSPLWPRSNEPPVGAVGLGFHLNVFIRKTPINTEEFRPMIGTDGSDLADWLDITFPGAGSKRNRLVFDRRTRGFIIFGTSEFPKVVAAQQREDYIELTRMLGLKTVVL